MIFDLHMFLQYFDESCLLNRQVSSNLNFKTIRDLQWSIHISKAQSQRYQVKASVMDIVPSKSLIILTISSTNSSLHVTIPPVLLLSFLVSSLNRFEP